FFQQDNALPHKSRQAKLWLEEQSSEFGVLPFPPDLNVIEHIWDAMNACTFLHVAMFRGSVCF
uniref:Tc1-like transposase DDE domain-containing protein n=1 Tax=Esox lucius TaxID=8010 RepID=A0AAY5K718_ESOLU